LALGRKLLVVLKFAAAAAVLVAAALAGRAGVEHLVRSPRFAVKDIAIAPSQHAPRELVLAVGGVALGDRLLLLDTERVERRLLRLPWVESVKVRRALPSTLVIDIAERHAAAAAVLGGLYLIDERGHPFKKATAAEAADFVVITGISRSLFVTAAEPAEAALREGLSLLQMYQRPGQGSEGGKARSALSEIRVEPRAGFTLVLLEGGTEIVLGRADLPARLERFDVLTAALGAKGLAELRVVHLDGPNLGRIPVLPRPAPEEEGAQVAPAPAPPVVTPRLPRRPPRTAEL
jgi:cell division protein FtsQ